jgi:hypothetical protein
MRIAGKTPSFSTAEVRIPRRSGEDLVLQVRSLPGGFEERVLGWIPSPKPPRELVVNAKGVWVPDERGKPAWTENESDPTYQEQAREATKLQSVAFIHEALKQDRDVTWEVDEREPGLWDHDKVAYYKAIRDELHGAGFSSGDLRILFEAVLALSNAGGKAVQEAAEAFLSKGPAAGSAVAGRSHEARPAPCATQS